MHIITVCTCEMSFQAEFNRVQDFFLAFCIIRVVGLGFCFVYIYFWKSSSQRITVNKLLIKILCLEYLEKCECNRCCVYSLLSGSNHISFKCFMEELYSYELLQEEEKNGPLFWQWVRSIWTFMNIWGIDSFILLELHEIHN